MKKQKVKIRTIKYTKVFLGNGKEVKASLHTPNDHFIKWLKKITAKNPQIDRESGNSWYPINIQEIEMK